jgi:hypothetical protein
MFLKPEVVDIHITCEIFNLFEGSSRLGCNLSKNQLSPIRCSSDQVELAINLFPCQLVQFLIKYLGVPLSIMKLPKSSLQPLVDRMADRLPSWKGNLMNCSNRLAHIKSTLIAMTFYTTICIKLTRWLLWVVEKLTKAFLWTGSDEVQGGKCLLAWGRVQHPLRLGGLGILDLCLFGHALQV